MKLQATARLLTTAAGDDIDALAKKYDDIVSSRNAKAAQEFVEETSDKDLAIMMNDRKLDTFFQELFPSMWGHVFKVPYPAKLAKILVKSKVSESITDISNCFYSKDRRLDAESLAVFMKDIASLSPKEVSDQLFQTGAISAEEPELPNGFLEFVKHSPQLVKKILMKLPKDTIEKLKKDEYTEKEIRALL